MQNEMSRSNPASAGFESSDRAAHDSQGSRNMIRSGEDLRYFQERAEQELRRAELAQHPDAARSHSLLAGYYLDLVYSCSLGPPDLPRRP
jgi:hypothetical protein